MALFEGLLGRRKGPEIEGKLPSLEELKEFFAERDDQGSIEESSGTALSDSEAKELRETLRENRARRDLLQDLRRDNDSLETETAEKEILAKELLENLKRLTKEDEFISEVRERLKLNNKIIYLGKPWKEFNSIGIVPHTCSVFLDCDGFKKAFGCGYYPARDQFHSATIKKLGKDDLIRAELTLSKIYAELERFVRDEIKR